MSTEELRIADPEAPAGDLVALEKSLAAATTTVKADEPKPEVTKPEEKVEVSKPDGMPNKFWTGDVNESYAKMASGFKNLESAYGRMANDLGTQRQITDRMLALDKRSNDLGLPDESVVKIDPTSLVDDPTKTLDAYWNTREDKFRKELAEEDSKRIALAEEAAFRAKHPDYEQVASSDEFAAWTNEDPLRLSAVARAAQGDLPLADQLLTEYYKAKQASTDAETTAEPVTDDVSGAKAAGTVSAAQAGGVSTSKQIYRRADLIRLKMEKPEVYADPAFQAEIVQAYAEKRVR